jgi:hypothetical protein
MASRTWRRANSLHHREKRPAHCASLSNLRQTIAWYS